MGQATRIPAADKAPEDFLPPAMPEVKKKIVTITLKRADGSEETRTLILRPGDVASIDGVTIAEG